MNIHCDRVVWQISCKHSIINEPSSDNLCHVAQAFVSVHFSASVCLGNYWKVKTLTKMPWHIIKTDKIVCGSASWEHAKLHIVCTIGHVMQWETPGHNKKLLYTITSESMTAGFPTVVFPPHCAMVFCTVLVHSGVFWHTQSCIHISISKKNKQCSSKFPRVCNVTTIQQN